MNEEKEIPPPEIYLQMPEGGFDFDTDSVELIEPKITYDIKSTYAWFENDEQFHDEKDYIFQNKELGSYEYKFTVETAYGSDVMDIMVHSLHINTFEEFDGLNDDGYFNSPEAGYHLFKEFVQYPCFYDANTSENWGGFALSDNTDKSDADIENEFSVYASSGADESDIFTVFKQVEGANYPITFSDGKSHKIKSIDVNNGTRSYLTMQSGFNKKEGQDYFLLSVNGHDASGAVISGPVEFLLADYRPEQTGDKYIISEWSKVDLTALGHVHQLSFTLSSSRDDDNEFDLPMYFCLDNLKIIE